MAIEQVRFAGIDGSGLRLGDGRWDESVLDGVGMIAVVDLGEGALEVPIELQAVIFVVLEALEFLDVVELELGAEASSFPASGKRSLGFLTSAWSMTAAMSFARPGMRSPMGTGFSLRIMSMGSRLGSKR